MDSNELRTILLQAFSEEAPELLEKCESALMDLERAEATNARHFIDALKRSLHSLKGSASAIGRHDLRDVCHAMEERLLVIMDSGCATEDLDALHHGLQYLRSGCASPAEVGDGTKVVALLSCDSVPDNDIPDEAVVVEEAAVVEHAAAESITEKEKNNVFSETIRVSIPKIDNLQSCIGELVAVRLQQEDSLGKLSEVRDTITNLAQHWRHISQDIREIRSLLPPVVAARMDTRMSTYSSAMKTAQRALFYLSNQMASQTGQVSLLSDAMDNGIRAIRMMPLGPFLESFRSVARDAARLLGKNVVLDCEDKGIEVDRLVLEHIREPLLHLVRNCVSHGIETPERRRAVAKLETGQVQLRAELSGEFVAITVMDDGAGFDRARIYQKARESGLVRSEEELTNEKMVEVVTRSGFSTAKGTDTVSGRGIGMDVVATMIYELGGSIELQTMDGIGASITLRVPSSLATTQGLVLQVGTQRFGVVLDTVERIVRFRLDALATVEGKPVLYLDEQPIAITSLATVLGLPMFEPRNMRIAYPIVILRLGSMRLAVIVDDIPGEIPMIVKPLGQPFEAVTIYAGGAILADGSVLPVVESRQVIHLVAQHAALRLQDVQAPEHEEVHAISQESSNSVRSILVVDDSITTRTLERNILEAAGYRVFVATDGMEATDLLRAEDSISLLVTDMEMPRMNGLELCRYVRTGRHARLPIIMVTSIGSDAEKQQGLQAGADAYIVKGNFQQDHFLSTVRRFVQA
ncbi:MAG TPA: response regulator [Pseudomonadales bacterium]|nr:response regulator [Pseudomonadales bacterium]